MTLVVNVCSFGRLNTILFFSFLLLLVCLIYISIFIIVVICIFFWAHGLTLLPFSLAQIQPKVGPQIVRPKQFLSFLHQPKTLSCMRPCTHLQQPTLSTCMINHTPHLHGEIKLQPPYTITYGLLLSIIFSLSIPPAIPSTCTFLADSLLSSLPYIETMFSLT